MVIVLVIVIIVLLPVIYNLLFPLTYPSLDNFFAPGQILESKWEGVAQKIIHQDGDKVYTEAILQPGAQGPPEHLHEGFSETAVVKQGILTVKVNGQTSELKAGDRLHFPKGEYHCFSNNSNEVVIMGGENENDYIPISFAYALAHIYEIFDRPSKIKMVHFFFTTALLGDRFDSYIKRAPVNSQKLMKKMLKPYARALGYKVKMNVKKES